MFSKEIEDLFKGNNFEVLKILSQYNPEKFKNDVHSLSDKGYSFFVSLLSENHEVTYVKNILELCESFGYNFTESKRPYDEDDACKLLHPKHKKSSYNYGEPSIFNIKNPEFTPEYIFAWSHANNDDTTAFLTEKMGKEKMLQLEKEGWPILEYAYRRKHFKTIRLLSEYGLDYDNPPSGVSILDIAKDDLRLIDIFWEIKNKEEQNNSVFMTDGQFQQFYHLFEKNIKSINTKRDSISDAIIGNIEVKKDLFSKEQKEKLLIHSLSSPDDKVFKYLCKLLKYKQKSTEIKDILIENLEKLTTHDLLYWVIEDETYLFKKVKNSSYDNPRNNVYGIDKISSKLSNLQISPFSDYGYNKNQKVINNTFTEKFKLIFKNDNLILKELDQGFTLFDRILTDQLSRGNLYKFINISPKKSNDVEYSLFKTLSLEQYEKIKNGNEKLSNEQKDEINDLLSKTWLKKDEYGKTNLEKCGVFSVIHSDTFLFNSIFMEDNDIYNNSMKMMIFQDLVEHNSGSYVFTEFPNKWIKNSGEIETYKLMKNLYFILSEDPETKWSNLQLSEKAIKNLRNNEFLFELRARQMSEDLNQEMSVNKTIKTKVKL